jgi:uncharacterized membrane protein
MKNKNVGYLIIGIAIVIVLIIFIFNQAMTSIVKESCSHGPSCSMYGTIESQTYLSFAIAGIIIAIGIFFVFSKESEKIIIKTKKVLEKKKSLDISGLNSEEKQLIELLHKENNAMFQRTLMEILNIGKVKTTRLLDKLESKGFIERKRRGMNNIVVLKEM